MLSIPTTPQKDEKSELFEYLQQQDLLGDESSNLSNIAMDDGASSARWVWGWPF